MAAATRLTRQAARNSGLENDAPPFVAGGMAGMAGMVGAPQDCAEKAAGSKRSYGLRRRSSSAAQPPDQRAPPAPAVPADLGSGSRRKRRKVVEVAKAPVQLPAEPSVMAPAAAAPTQQLAAVAAAPAVAASAPAAASESPGAPSKEHTDAPSRFPGRPKPLLNPTAGTDQPAACADAGRARAGPATAAAAASGPAIPPPQDLYALPETELSPVYRKRELDYGVDGEVLGDLTDNMWKILVDWMIEVQINYTLSQETLFLAVDIFNRYIRLKAVSRGDLQLIGAASLMLGSKYEEIYPPEVGEFVYICAGTYSRDALLDAERDVLVALKYKLSAPLAWHYLNWFGSRAELSERTLHLAQYFLELTLQERQFATYKRSMMAAAAINLAGKVCECADEKLEQVTVDSGCDKNEIIACARRLNRLVVSRQDERFSPHHANCRKKYSESDHSYVGLLPVHIFFYPEAVAADAPHP